MRLIRYECVKMFVKYQYASRAVYTSVRFSESSSVCAYLSLGCKIILDPTLSMCYGKDTNNLSELDSRQLREHMV